MNHQLLTVNDVSAKTRISRSTIYRKAKAGEFPQPRRTGGKSVHWIESEIDEWIENLPEADPNDLASSASLQPGAGNIRPRPVSFLNP